MRAARGTEKSRKKAAMVMPTITSFCADPYTARRPAMSLSWSRPLRSRHTHRNQPDHVVKATWRASGASFCPGSRWLPT